MSFINERVQPEGLTFDDVLLVPAYSEVLPREVSVETRFSILGFVQYDDCIIQRTSAHKG